MIYIFTALFPEAKPLISHLGLKRSADQERFPVYTSPDQEFLLAVTGTGPVSAAIVSSYVFTCRKPQPSDHIVNVGVCAGLGTAQAGECYLCTSLGETDTGKSYYPDLLWKHSFPEAALFTGSRILSDPDDSSIAGYIDKDRPLLYDMEATALYQSASVYAGPHQMSFLKIVSDRADGHVPSAKEVSELVGKHLPAVLAYIDRLPDSAQEAPSLPMLEQLSEDLHCSVSMKYMLQQYLTWAALSNSSPEEKIRQLYAAGTLPCKDRKEGKKILEQLRSFLL